MRLALVTAFPDLHTNRRLLEAANQRGVPFDVLPPATTLPAAAPDAALLRVGLSERLAAFALAERMETRGTRLLNTATACATAKDKWLTHHALSSARLPQLPTRLLEPGQPLTTVLPDESIGPFPVVVKTRLGSHGVGVHLVHTVPELEEVRAGYARDGYAVLVQRYQKPLRELRVLIVSGEVTAALERTPAPTEFRANWHRGAGLTAVDDLDEHVAGLAREAARTLRLGVAGVDVFVTDTGLYVLEVNDAPGIEGAEQATGRDLAMPIVDALIALV